MDKFNSYSYIWSSTRYKDSTNKCAYCIDCINIYTYHIFLKQNAFRCRIFYRL